MLAFRVGQGQEQHYIVEDHVLGQTIKLEPWQFFILEVLPGCEDFTQLASVFEDRFGHEVTDNEVEAFFGFVTEKKLFGPAAAKHPLVEAFAEKRESREWTSSATNSEKPSATKPEEPKKKTESAAAVDTDDQPLPAGIRDALGLDDTMHRRGWKLFNPTRFIKFVQPLLKPFRHTVYLLPILFLAALFISFRNSHIIEEDLARLLESMSFITHALISMVTVNLAVTMVTALVAHTYRATVSGFCIVFYLGFFPRFMVRIGHVRQLSRRERIWLHASPLLMRLALFSFGILLWYNTRHAYDFLATLGLAVALASAISFILTINPLVKSSGYHLVAALLNEPHLRGKSYRALINKFRGNVYQKADDTVLAAYALASLLFMLAVFTGVIFVLGRFLKIHLGGAGVLLIIILAVILITRMVEKFKRIIQLYERSVQFERWRNRTLPKVEDNVVTQKKPRSFQSYAGRALPFILLVLLFVPYKYEPGGSFVILPEQQQEITAELSGILEEINFDGGEVLKKGTEIGRLSHSEHLAQLKIYDARMLEQQAVINELNSRPKLEEVQLAERTLEVEKRRAKFSKAKLERLEKLYEEKTISFEDLDDAQREYEVDLEQVEEKRANLELTKLGATPDEIAAAEAKLLSYKEQHDFYQEKIDQSIFHMPFDGKLVTMHLKQKVGSYLDKGDTLAMVENTSQVIAEIDIPEPDIGYIENSAEVRGRAHAYYNEDFKGIVTAIDSNVTEKKSGKVVKVVTLLDNNNGRLQSGMTGYAKISSETLPLWKVLSLAIIRFIKVEVWSWLP